MEWCCLTWPGQNGGRLQGCTVWITNRDDKKKLDQRITWQGTSPHMVVHVGTRNSPEMSIRFQGNEVCPLQTMPVDALLPTKLELDVDPCLVVSTCLGLRPTQNIPIFLSSLLLDSTAWVFFSMPGP